MAPIMVQFVLVCSHATSQNLEVPGNRRPNDHGFAFQAKGHGKNMISSLPNEQMNEIIETLFVGQP